MVRQSESAIIWSWLLHHSPVLFIQALFETGLICDIADTERSALCQRLTFVVVQHLADKLQTQGRPSFCAIGRVYGRTFQKKGSLLWVEAHLLTLCVNKCSCLRFS